MQPAKTMPVTAGGRLTKVIVNPLGAGAPGRTCRARPVFASTRRGRGADGSLAWHAWSR